MGEIILSFRFPHGGTSQTPGHMSRDEAYSLLTEHTQSKSLIGHALSVEAAMRHYAGRLDGDADLWSLAGLLHVSIMNAGLRSLSIRGKGRTFCAHVGWAKKSSAQFCRTPNGIKRNTRWIGPSVRCSSRWMNLCGFITAVAYVRPNGLDGMKAKSVRKKLKAKNFAAAVSREDIDQGAALLDMDLNEHITEVIIALQKAAK